LVLIDGVQINDPSSTGGGFDFGNLLVGDIARIEVLRGPQSTLYGSQAIGGVVNILTREPQGDVAGNIESEYGSFNSRQIKGGVGGQFDRLTFRLGASNYRTDSVSAFVDGTEDDAFRNTTVAGRLGFAFTSGVSLDLRAYYADGKSEADGFPPPFFVFADERDYALSRQLVAYGGLNFDLLNGRLTNRVAYQTTETDRGTYLEDASGVTRTGAFSGKNQRYEYQGVWKLTDRINAVFGAQRERAEMTSDSSPSHAEVDQDSYYLQLQAALVKGLTLTAGERYDDHEAFGSHKTGQLAAAWAFDSGMVLRASWGEGFKAPSLYQLYSPYANPQLDPEQSRGWDAGVEQHFLDRATLSATYFQRKTTNQIDFLDCPFPLNAICIAPGHSTFGYYENLARTRSKGIELQGTFDITPEFRISANYTQMKATDESPGLATLGQRLLRRPDTLANASLSYVWPIRLTTTLAVRYTGSSLDNDFDVFPAARVTLDSYTLLDFRAGWQVSDHVEIAGRVENAFDEDYQTVLRFGTVGRAGYISVNLKL
jgi:vitamin B12 transporter